MTEENKPVVKKTPLADTKMALDAAGSLGVPAQQLINLIKHQVISVPKDEPPATDAELAMVLGIIHAAGLNPLSGDVYAWRDNKGKMCVQASPDGWAKTAKNDKNLKFITYEEGPIVPSPDGKGEECYEWMRATIRTADGDDVPQPRVWLSEWYVRQGRYAGPWQKQTKHRLFIVTNRLAIRFFCGLGGIMVDEEQSFYQKGRPSMTEMTEKATEDMAAGKQLGYEDVIAPGKWEHGEAPGPEDADFEPVEDDDILPPLPEGEPRLLSDKLETITCAVPECVMEGTQRCGSCAQLFCMSHMSEDPDRCPICFNGG